MFNLYLHENLIKINHGSRQTFRTKSNYRVYRPTARGLYITDLMHFFHKEVTHCRGLHRSEPARRQGFCSGSLDTSDYRIQRRWVLTRCRLSAISRRQSPKRGRNFKNVTSLTSIRFVRKGMLLILCNKRTFCQRAKHFSGCCCLVWQGAREVRKLSTAAGLLRTDPTKFAGNLQAKQSV